MSLMPPQVTKQFANCSYVLLYIATVGTYLSVFGSPRNGQAAVILVSKTSSLLGLHL